VIAKASLEQADEVFNGGGDGRGAEGLGERYSPNVLEDLSASGH
jgi:hypothetical protein